MKIRWQEGDMVIVQRLARAAAVQFGAAAEHLEPAEAACGDIERNAGAGLQHQTVEQYACRGDALLGQQTLARHPRADRFCRHTALVKADRQGASPVSSLLSSSCR